MEQYLEKISHNTSAKRSQYIVCRGNDSIIKTVFSPTIGVKGCEIAVVGLSTYYSYPNIDDTNNLIEIMNYDFTKRVTTIIQLVKGCYEIDEINEFIMKKMGWTKENAKVEITADPITLRTHLLIKKGMWHVNFPKKNSIATILGFEPKWYPYNAKDGKIVPYISQKIANILTVNNILVQCDIISGSSINGKSAPVIYNYSPTVKAGHKIVAQPFIPIYLPVTVEFIHQLCVWVTDQDNKLLDLQGEDLVVTFHLRSR